MHNAISEWNMSDNLYLVLYLVENPNDKTTYRVFDVTFQMSCVKYRIGVQY